VRREVLRLGIKEKEVGESLLTTSRRDSEGLDGWDAATGEIGAGWCG
jgi:hypothetical protein